MKKKLDLLEQLQEIDLAIDALKCAQNCLQEELGEIGQGLDVARSELAGMEEQVARLEQEKGELEAGHAAEMENIRRSEANMREIKTNKEYQAVGREIAAARKQASEIEEQLLQRAARLDELLGEIDTRKEALAALEQSTLQQSSEKRTEIAKIQQDIDADVERRETISRELPPGLIKRYTSLRGQRRGQALAIARDGYCLGCNMNLPPQLYNTLFRGDELISCPHCQRVLILKQQPQA